MYLLYNTYQQRLKEKVEETWFVGRGVRYICTKVGT